jgi:hypothetical protein
LSSRYSVCDDVPEPLMAKFNDTSNKGLVVRRRGLRN